MNTSERTNQIRNLIESLGGTCVGVQTSFGNGDDFIDEDRVIFTRGNSTTLLSLPVSDCTQLAIQEKLGKKVHKTEKCVYIDTMRSLSERLHDLSKTVDACIQWMEKTSETK